MLVTSFGGLCLTLVLKDRGCWWQKRVKPSPISQTCLQHISSPTSVTNIDVAFCIQFFPTVMVTFQLDVTLVSHVTNKKMTYERLLQTVAVNLFDVPKFQKSQFSKDFLLLNPTLLLHLLLPMQRNCLACLVACHSIEFSRMKTDEVQVWTWVC